MTMTEPQATDTTAENLAQHCAVLFRYALVNLRDPDLAEDAVQDTLLAACRARKSFAGRSSERTWLIGILKHKITDIARGSGREISLDYAEGTVVDGTGEEAWFDSSGAWNSRPEAWSHPELALEQQEFWAIFEWCQRNLPAKLARVFVLRELVGLDAEEICKETGITPTNYWVVLHRARLRLRECLAVRWFGESHAEKR